MQKKMVVLCFFVQKMTVAGFCAKNDGSIMVCKK